MTGRARGPAGSAAKASAMGRVRPAPAVASGARGAGGASEIYTDQADGLKRFEARLCESSVRGSPVPHHGEDLVFLGETTRFEFGKDEVTLARYLESPGASRFDLGLGAFADEQIPRTEGSRFVVSAATVFNAERHRDLPRFRRKLGRLTCVVKTHGKRLFE